MGLRFIDLFAGIGGFHYGIDVCNQCQIQTKQTNDRNLSLHRINNVQKSLFTCVYSNEWDKYANSVYRRHYGECDNRDIRTVDASLIPDHDLLCGGFPCQSFSIAGKRGGFDDTRGTLFFDIARILTEKQPRLCLLENVKGLLSHAGGRTFKTIITTLAELGYDLQWQVLNSKNFGVPQNRERVFIVGHLRGTPRPKVFPISGNNQEVTFGPITTSAGRNRATGSNYVNEIQSGKVNNGAFIPTKDEALCLDTNYYNGFDNHGQRTGLTDGLNIRRLTPIECERLQGFPDNWTKIGIKKCDGTCKKDTNGGFDLMKCGGHEVEISDTQRYKMCGNAVTTNVITEIVRRLI